MKCVRITSKRVGQNITWVVFIVILTFIEDGWSMICQYNDLLEFFFCDFACSVVYAVAATLIYSVASVKRRAGLLVVAMHWWLETWLDKVWSGPVEAGRNIAFVSHQGKFSLC